MGRRRFGPEGATDSSQGWSEALRAEPLETCDQKKESSVEPRRGDRPGKMKLITEETTGKTALQTLQASRLRFPVTGLYPFLIGDAEELERIEEVGEGSQPGHQDSIVRESLEIDVGAWISGKREALAEDGFSTDDLLGNWPEAACEPGSIGLHKDVLSGKFKPSVFLGFAKIALPWQLPAVLNYGGWNDCPEAAVHCAFHRKWFTEYGAEITGMSGDIVECLVRSPPRSREAAIQLAWEQFWYCEDIVDQGCGSISNLAATLLNSDYWYFWWD